MLRRGVWSDRRPYSVVPESPATRSRVPHQLSPRRPRRWWWLRGRPRRRRSPARRTTLGCRTLPVIAAIPVPVVGVAPAWVRLIAWAPVRAGRRGRGRLGPGAGAAGRSESRQCQPATQQRARRPPDPRPRLLCSRHLPRVSLRHESKQVVIPSHLEPRPAETLKRNSTTRRSTLATRVHPGESARLVMTSWPRKRRGAPSDGISRPRRSATNGDRAAMERDC
jgi:hypothetical protein